MTEKVIDESGFAGFEIKTLQDLYRFMSIIRGHDPDAQQTINKFMEFSDPIERTYLPSQSEVKRISYLSYVGKVLYPDNPDNPFTEAANRASTAYMALKGWKSDGFVEMVKKTPDLSEIQTYSEAIQQRGFFDRFKKRGGGEE